MYNTLNAEQRNKFQLYANSSALLQSFLLIFFGLEIKKKELSKIWSFFLPRS